MRSSHFWDVTQRRLVVSYRSFGATYRSYSRVKQSKKKYNKYISISIKFTKSLGEAAFSSRKKDVYETFEE
jgi:hypothetical protein